jgi:ornithine cyclodeaminase
MATCIDVMDRAMRAHTCGAVATPPRIIASLIDGSGYFAVMPGSMREPAIYGAKVVSLHPGNPDRGLPAVQGFVTLFDHATGASVAIVEGAAITAVRTAAASGLATRELARPDASSHGIFGAGVLAATHIEAIACVRDIERVLVWARDAKKAGRFAAEQAERTGLDVRAAADPAEAGACDIVSAVTGASEPVVRGAWLSPGAHLNLVGAHSPKTREADSEAVARSALYVDSRESAMSEAGDLLIPMEEGVISADAIVGEIGEVLGGQAPGRANGEQITLYKSLGVVAQDLFAAEFVFRAAATGGTGQVVKLD